MWKRFAVLLLSTAVGAVCAETPDDVGRVEPQGRRGVARKSFESEHPGVDVAINTGASGMLARQIEEGAPVDVFVSAGWPEIERAAGEAARARRAGGDRAEPPRPGRAEGARRGSGRTARAPRVARRDSASRAAIPRSCRSAKYAQQALQAAGLWAQVEPKLVPRIRGAPGAHLRRAGRSTRRSSMRPTRAMAKRRRAPRRGAGLPTDSRSRRLAARMTHGTSELARARSSTTWTGAKARAALPRLGFLAP